MIRPSGGRLAVTVHHMARRWGSSLYYVTDSDLIELRRILTSDVAGVLEGLRDGTLTWKEHGRWLAGVGGLWHWCVPAPKGHPRTPPLISLHGTAPTMESAVAAGLFRLEQIYGDRT